MVYAAILFVLRFVCAATVLIPFRCACEHARRLSPALSKHHRRRTSGLATTLVHALGQSILCVGMSQSALRSPISHQCLQYSSSTACTFNEHRHRTEIEAEPQEQRNQRGVAQLEISNAHREHLQGEHHARRAERVRRAAAVLLRRM